VTVWLCSGDFGVAQEVRDVIGTMERDVTGAGVQETGSVESLDGDTVDVFGSETDKRQLSSTC